MQIHPCNVFCSNIVRPQYIRGQSPNTAIVGPGEEERETGSDELQGVVPVQGQRIVVSHRRSSRGVMLQRMELDVLTWRFQYCCSRHYEELGSQQEDGARSTLCKRRACYTRKQYPIRQGCSSIVQQRPEDQMVSGCLRFPSASVGRRLWIDEDIWKLLLCSRGGWHYGCCT